MAYVLAGGRGSRLKELTDRRAKPAVYFGGKTRIIDFALSNALNSGIRRIGVATQYKAHSLIRHLQRGWNFFRAGAQRELRHPARVAARQRDASGTRAPPTRCTRTSTSSRTTARATWSSSPATTSTRWTTSSMLQQHVEQGADVTVGCLEVPRMEATGFGVMHVDENGPDHRLRREAHRPAGHPRPARHGARLDGHLRLPHARSSPTCCAATPRRRARAATSART